MQGEEILRGEIYFVYIPHATGHEMEKDRPAIVVSCEELNRTSPCVTVVMCSASPKKELPEHVTIRSTPLPSTALCEHIYTVDKSRLRRYVGRCTRAELAQVDIGIISALALGAYGLARPEEEETEHTCDMTPDIDEAGLEDARLRADAERVSLVRAQTERDTYKRLYEQLLDSLDMKRRAGA